MRILVIDTCGDIGSIALAEDEAVLAVEHMSARKASAELLTAIQTVIAQAGWELGTLQGIGVVNGPGSFTGTRVGLAAAKGLCTALHLPLAPVSRLALLTLAADLRRGYAVLDAGRDEVYVRRVWPGGDSHESLERVSTLLESGPGEFIALAEERLLERFAAAGPRLYSIDVATAVPLVLHSLRQGGESVALMDANYVRGEGEIYGRSRPVKAALT